jgi:hypothetical protein
LFSKPKWRGLPSAKQLAAVGRKDCWIFAANGTLSIAPQVQLSEFYLERVEVEEASNHRLADAHNQLDRLNRKVAARRKVAAPMQQIRDPAARALVAGGLCDRDRLRRNRKCLARE